MRRMVTVLLGFSLLVAACGGDGSVLGPETSVTTSLTVPDTTEATSPEVTAPMTTGTTVPPLGMPGLSVHQVLARYDGVTGAGTLEATVCNLGESDDIEPAVVMVANGIEVALGGIAIPPRSCRGFYDATVDLPGFGVTAPGTVTVGVTATPEGEPAEAVSITGIVEVPAVVVEAPADQLQEYRGCIASGQNHRNCVGTVPHHPIPDAGEIMLVKDRYVAIGPESNGEVLSFFLADNSICTPRLEAWMGTTGPDPISHRVVVADDYDGAYAARFVGIYSLGPQNRWDEANVNVSDWWRDVLQGYCGNAHEMTHLLLGNTPMPSLIEEGLATYLEADDRSGSGREPLVTCSEDAWYGWRFEDGEGEHPYEDLTVWDPDVYGIYYYYTGMCFWDYLATTYGENIIQDIVGATAAYRDPGYNGCIGLTGTVLFMEDIVTPILGEDISPITEERWGFGATFTGCEGL